eukprot:1158173-Pelagomonas_calceolata.AAC.2
MQHAPSDHPLWLSSSFRTTPPFTHSCSMRHQITHCDSPPAYAPHPPIGIHAACENKLPLRDSLASVVHSMEGQPSLPLSQEPGTQALHVHHHHHLFKTHHPTQWVPQTTPNEECQWSPQYTLPSSPPPPPPSYIPSTPYPSPPSQP